MAKIPRSFRHTVRRVWSDARELAASALVAGVKAGLVAAAVAAVADVSGNIQRKALASRRSRRIRVAGAVATSVLAGLMMSWIRMKAR